MQSFEKPEIYPSIGRTVLITTLLFPTALLIIAILMIAQYGVIHEKCSIQFICKNIVELFYFGWKPILFLVFVVGPSVGLTRVFINRFIYPKVFGKRAVYSKKKNSG